jgi:hypothetical protein
VLDRLQGQYDQPGAWQFATGRASLIGSLDWTTKNPAMRGFLLGDPETMSGLKPPTYNIPVGRKL